MCITYNCVAITPVIISSDIQTLIYKAFLPRIHTTYRQVPAVVQHQLCTRHDAEQTQILVPTSKHFSQRFCLLAVCSSCPFNYTPSQILLERLPKNPYIFKNHSAHCSRLFYSSGSKVIRSLSANSRNAMGTIALSESSSLPLYFC